MRLLQVSMVYINTLMMQEVLAEPDWQNRLELEDRELSRPSPMLMSNLMVDLN